MLFFVCLYGLVWFGLFFIPYHLRQCGYCLNLTSLTETARSTFSLRSHFSSHTVKGYKEGSWQVSDRSTLWQTLNLFLFCLWMETISDFFFLLLFVCFNEIVCKETSLNQVCIFLSLNWRSHHAYLQHGTLLCKAAIVKHGLPTSVLQTGVGIPDISFKTNDL